MLRLVEIPDAVLDSDDLAMWLMFFPETMGFGTIPKYIISDLLVNPVFTQDLQYTATFTQQIRFNEKLYSVGS